jgi:hypothetical protein
MRTFGPKKEEEAGGWRRLHNEELHKLYASPDSIRLIKSRMMGWTEHVARMGEMRNVDNILVEKPEGKRILERPRRIQKNNITMDLREIGWEDTDWIHIARDRDQWRAVVNTVMNLRVPFKGGNSLTR